LKILQYLKRQLKLQLSRATGLEEPARTEEKPAHQTGTAARGTIRAAQFQQTGVAAGKNVQFSYYIRDSCLEYLPKPLTKVILYEEV